MNKRKTIQIWACISAILFVLALSALCLSVYFGEQTKDPDAYGFFGMLAMLGIMFLAIVAGCITLGIWLSQRSKTLELFNKS